MKIECENQVTGIQDVEDFTLSYSKLFLNIAGKSSIEADNIRI
jgi:hypothetical protein